MIVVTDRLALGDAVPDTPIPHKGAVLNGLSNFWFNHTRKVVDNHFIDPVDPNVTLVREARPLGIEMRVRGYLTGSMWRRYRKGKRNFCGLRIPDGLKENEQFPVPIITPFVRGEEDEQVEPAEIIKRGLAEKSCYEQMEAACLRLFREGSRFMRERGVLLVDSRYEFGIIQEELVLIDELHTPDSSVLWYLEDYERDHLQVQALDRAPALAWLRDNPRPAGVPWTFPEEVVEETSRRYLKLYEAITGEVVDTAEENLQLRMYRSLVSWGLIRDGFVAIVMASEEDLDHCEAIAGVVTAYDVAIDLRVVSACLNPGDLSEMVTEYNECIEPGAVIAVAALSNGLGSALAGNLNLPVFNCPPFEDRDDLMVNLNSSLMLPPRAPAATVLRPESAAQAAIRALNLPRVKARLMAEMAQAREHLRQADRRTRGR